MTIDTWQADFANCFATVLQHVNNDNKVPLNREDKIEQNKLLETFL